MSTVETAVNPFPGPRPFESNEGELFFGRERESRELASLLVAHRVMLLYAQSGAGKTSLLNASLIPRLQGKGVEVLPIGRVRGLIPDEIRPADVENPYVLNALIAWSEQAVRPQQLAQMSIADYLKEREKNASFSAERPCVAIIDQFEELFEFYPERWEKRQELFTQLDEALERFPLLRVLFVIREDYLADLEPYTSSIYGSLRTRYRLERLRPEPACEAVKRPVESAGRQFEPGAAEDLVRILLNVRVVGESGESMEVPGQYVEPVQLQVVCRTLWNRLEPSVQTITRSHLRELVDVDRALRDFYERAVRRAVKESRVSEADLRHWFDHELITPAGTRGMVFRGPESTGSVPNATVDLLAELRLVRAEYRAGARWYELTHDRFIGHQRLIATVSSDSTARLWEFQSGYPVLELSRHAEDELWQKLRRRVSWLWLGLLSVSAALAIALFVQLQRERAQAREMRARQIASTSLEKLTLDPELSGLLALQAVNMMREKRAGVLPEASDALLRAVENMRVRLTLTGHTSRVNDVAISPDQRLIATVSSDSTARLWEFQSGYPVLELSRHDDAALSVAFRPDSRGVAVGYLDGTIRVYDTVTGDELFALEGPDGSVYGVAFSPGDGARIATAGYGGRARIWDVETRETIAVLDAHSGPIYALAYSRDGDRLVTGSSDNTAIVWDAATGDTVMTLSGHTSEVYDVAFNPGGSRLITGSRDGTARIWSAFTGDSLVTLSSHTNTVFGVAFSPDGRQVATGSADRTIRIWDVSSAQNLFTLAGHDDVVYQVEFAGDGSRLASASWDNTAMVWDVSSIQHDGAVFAADFSPDGRHVAVASGVEAVTRPIGSGTDSLVLYHGDWVYDVAYSPDSSRLATAGADGAVRVYDTQTGDVVADVPGHARMIWSLAFSPDGTRLATASTDSLAKIHMLNDPDSVITFSGHGGTLRGVAFDREGERLVTASWDGTVRVWDAVTGDSLLAFAAHGHGVNDVAFSPDDSLLASVGYDGMARIWGAATGDTLRTLRGHTDAVWAVAFSPDGTRLATAGFDRTARLWDVATGEELLTLTGHWDALRDVAFSPDGKLLATVGLDRSLQLHPLDVDEIRAAARAQLTRPMTPEECRDHLEMEVCPRGPEEFLFEAKDLMRSGAMDSALAMLDEALAMDSTTAGPAIASLIAAARGHVRAGDPGPALSALERAHALDSTAVAATDWNYVCWYGSLSGYAEAVLSACERAVELDPENIYIRDSRGLARAMTGDRVGAVEDFRVFAEAVPNVAWRQQRLRWIQALEAGEDPFSEEVIRALFHE